MLEANKAKEFSCMSVAQSTQVISKHVSNTVVGSSSSKMEISTLVSIARENLMAMGNTFGPTETTTKANLCRDPDKAKDS